MEVSLSSWLSEVSGLFSGVLSAIYAVPVLRLFLGLLLLLVILGLFRLLVQTTRRGL